ncbi:hypothetical protein ACH5RR_032120 [Cinchona calisaya]|uniref:FAR1 domain-containing protein n=1 Tax=Cinchona calisaya TaxID=153742 RepID=A0ABD2YI95_9GENT
MTNSKNKRKNSENDDAICIDNDEEEAKFVYFICSGEEAINYKRKSYIEELEKLLLENVLHCEEEAYKLYCDYAFAVGFSVRRGKQYYFEGTKRVRAKMYCCSKEGLAIEREGGNGSNNNNSNSVNKLETRTGCKARVYFVSNNEGQWKVGKFVKEHNHEMAEEHERPRLRSARTALDSNYGGFQPMVSEMSSPCYEVESQDVIDLDSGEEEVMCLGCNGGEEAKTCEGSFDVDVDDLEKTLVAQVVQNEEEAYKVYCDYAHVVGFSVRKGKQYYFQGTKKIKYKSYYCSKEGFVKEDISVTTHHKLEARTGCKAMISFTCDDDGQWKVTRFIKEHNHKMAEPYERHLLRSARSVSDAKGSSNLQSTTSGLDKVTWSGESSAKESIAHGNSLLEPHEGMVFESEDAAKAFYDEYAKQVGFVMDVKLSCPSEVEERSIACCTECIKEGRASKCNELGPVEDHHRGSGARCQAMMLIKSDKSGKWVVSRFLRDHSHPLVVLPREVSYTMDEKDKKIQELTSELRNKKRLCAVYQEQLMLFTRVVEEHISQLSKKTDSVVRNLNKLDC